MINIDKSPMKFALVIVVLVIASCDLVKQNFLQRHASGDWG